MSRTCPALCIAALLAVTTSAPAAGQLSNPSPTALGMGNNYTALARGYAALAWNPANLALPGGPGVSAALGNVQVLAGLGPVTLSDLADVRGGVIGEELSRRWVAMARAEGRQAGGAGFDVVWGTVQFGRVGLQFATTGRATSLLTPDALELLLLGRVDGAAGAGDIDIAGSAVDMHLYTTAAAGYGLPLRAGPATVGLGAVVTYTFGHAMARGGAGDVAFPVAYTPLNVEGGQRPYQTGGGTTLGVGAAVALGRWSASAMARNVTANFAWDEGAVRFRRNSAALDEDASLPLSDAPAAVRESVAGYTFRPSWALGVAFEPAPQVSVAADARFGGEDGMRGEPTSHVGVGVEVRPLPVLALHAGAARVDADPGDAGHQLNAGARVGLGSFEIAASFGRRDFAGRRQAMFMAAVLSHRF